MTEGIWKLKMLTANSKITMNLASRFGTEQWEWRIAGEFARSNTHSLTAPYRNYKNQEIPVLPEQKKGSGSGV